MSDEQDNPQTDEAPTGDVATPGVLLQRASRDRGVSMEELIGQTKLTRQTLEALLADDFETLNEPVYVRGYYRKCAKVLDMDESQLLHAHESVVGAPVPRLPSYSASVEKAPRSPHDWIPWVVYGVIGGSLLLLVVWLLRGGDGRNGAPDPLSTSDVEVQAEVVEPAVEPSLSMTLGTRNAETEPESSPLAEPDADTMPEVTTASLSAAPVERGPGLLQMTFDDTCWVRIEDANGRRLLAGLMTAGSQREVRGEPPYTVFLGYAPGVAMTMDGQSVDFSEYVRSNNTARFSVTVE